MLVESKQSPVAKHVPEPRTRTLFDKVRQQREADTVIESIKLTISKSRQPRMTGG